jgi:hypothetical protein
MRRVVARSTVKPGQETVNEKLAQAVYDELHQTQPTGPQPFRHRLSPGDRHPAGKRRPLPGRATAAGCGHED